MAMAEDMPSVVHLAHPQPVAWRTLVGAAATTLGVTLVPYPDWIAKLEGSLLDTTLSEVAHMRAIPALRLLPFFRAVSVACASPGRDAIGLAQLDLSNAMVVAPALRQLKPLGEQDVARWLNYWKSITVL
jgi:hypothetical protein